MDGRYLADRWQTAGFKDTPWYPAMNLRGPLDIFKGGNPDVMSGGREKRTKQWYPTQEWATHCGLNRPCLYVDDCCYQQQIKDYLLHKETDESLPRHRRCIEVDVARQNVARSTVSLPVIMKLVIVMLTV